MGALPEGDPAPRDGALDHVLRDELSLYLHVPFCSVRCGYCDFNTYTAEELRRDGTVVSPQSYIQQATKELELARQVLGENEITIKTIFVGGGTPTLIAASDLVHFLARVRELFVVDPSVEITVEANPDTVSNELLDCLVAGGVNRLSIGMQSAMPHVLRVLERTHNPENVAAAVDAAVRAGIQHVSVDLIYGTPSETLYDWQQTLDQALALNIDHISAYALIVEEGTRLAQQVARGLVVMPDEDETAEKYVMADNEMIKHGFDWYELSNWAKPGGASRHNMAYWKSANWWGIGPGAHSHIDGVRWWNVKHPAAYASRLADGVSPALAREILDDKDSAVEAVMLHLRLREGLSSTLVDPDRRHHLSELVLQGLLTQVQDRFILTQRGRLLADTVVRHLID